MAFFIIPNFDANTEGGARCTVCGSIKQGHHKGVFRPDVVPEDMWGFNDVCEACIRQAADEIGFVTKRTHEAMSALLASANKEIARQHERVVEALDSQASLARMNVQLQDQIEELSAAPEELTPLEELFAMADARAAEGDE